MYLPINYYTLNTLYFLNIISIIVDTDTTQVHRVKDIDESICVKIHSSEMLYVMY